MEAAYDRLWPAQVARPDGGMVNSLAVDSAERQLLLSGHADSSLAVWAVDDLDNAEPGAPAAQPVAEVERRLGHTYGISKIAWWPLDTGMFVTASFDGFVKVWDARALEVVYPFDLEHKVYSFDLRAAADGPALVAAALDHPFIRLLDLRSGASAQTLQGHSGKVLSVKWSPAAEYLLASAGSDGTVRLWDIRQARANVASLDMLRSAGQELAPAEFRQAHRGAVNGLAWAPRGDELVSLGNDNKARLWDLSVPGGVNQSVNYGPLIQDRYLQTLDPLVSPLDDLRLPYVFIPSDTGDVLMCSLNDGTLVRRLQPPADGRQTRQACIAARGPRYAQYFTGDGNGNIWIWSPEPPHAEN